MSTRLKYEVEYDVPDRIGNGTGEWRVPLLVMLASMVPMAIAGWLAGRPLTVRTLPQTTTDSETASKTVTE